MGTLNSMKNFLLSENVCIELSVLLKDKHSTCLIQLHHPVNTSATEMWLGNCCHSFHHSEKSFHWEISPQIYLWADWFQSLPNTTIDKFHNGLCSSYYCICMLKRSRCTVMGNLDTTRRDVWQKSTLFLCHKLYKH